MEVGEKSLDGVAVLEREAGTILAGSEDTEPLRRACLEKPPLGMLLSRARFAVQGVDSLVYCWTP